MIPGSLVALTPGRLRGGDPAGRGAALRAIEAAVEGGVRALLVREYGLEDGPLLAFARDAASVLRSADGPTWFGMHDRAHLAAAVGADAVQLGGRSLPPEDARSVVPKGVALGLSTHTGDDPHALDGSVDFALHAPVFVPHSKPAPEGGPLGPEAAAAFAERAAVPVLALGGIDEGTLAELERCGPARSALAGAACIGGLWGTAGPSGAYDLGAIRERAGRLTERARSLFEGDPS